MSVPGDRVLGQEPSSTPILESRCPCHSTYIGDKGGVSSEQPSYILDISTKGKKG